MKIITLALEKRMLLDVKDHIEIARRAAVKASFTQPRKTDAGPVFYTGWNFRVHRPLTKHTPFPFAFWTRISNHTARALARRTSTCNAEEALLITYLSAPRARPARHWRLTARGARASAILASLVASHGNRGLGAEYSFLECQVDVLAQVGATLGAAATARSLAKNVSETEEFAENIAEILEDTGIETASARGGSYPRMAKTVVHRALFAVRQDRVSLARFLELFFGVRIIRIAVGMKLQREFAISALELDVGDRAAYAQYLVVVAFCVRGQSKPFFKIRNVGKVGPVVAGFAPS